TRRTVMLGRGHQQSPRTPYVEIPHIMQRQMRRLVPIGRVTTTRTRVPYVVATVGDDLGLGQVCGGGDPGAGVGSVRTWTEHRVALLAQRCGPALYAKRLLGATRCSRYSLQKTPGFWLPWRGTRLLCTSSGSDKFLLDLQCSASDDAGPLAGPAQASSPPAC